MIFFRVHTARVKCQRGDESFLLFGKLKAIYAAPVDDLSGMSVNLKDVDGWMKEALKEAPSFRHLEEVLFYYYKTLKNSSPAFKKLEFKLGSVMTIYDGKTILHTYTCKTWFKQGQSWVQRSVKILSSRRLSQFFWIQLRQKKWSSPEAFAKILARLSEVLFLKVKFAWV
jgi:hypothetical protein